MPKIYDNIQHKFSEGLLSHIATADRVDYCVGYFNLRGWRTVCDSVSALPGASVIESGQTVTRYVRLLVGMTKTHKEEVLEEFADPEELSIDNEKANNYRKRLAHEFAEQLTIGIPTQNDEMTLQKLLWQLEDGKVVVKLFLKHQLHAKLYLAHSTHEIAPKTGLLGSSNFTFSGLSAQGELNIDVIEQDAVVKLDEWFNHRWNDRWCLDITKDLIDVLSKSWARTDLIPPFHIYLKMAYHLSREARAGLAEYKISKEFSNQLLDFQQSAVKIVAHHLHKRNGVMIGDVVGLGKTITACAIAKILEDDLLYNTLIVCPKNLVSMWNGYREKYGLHASVLSHSQLDKLADMRRYRLIIVDESHNFRNNEGSRYRQLKQYIEENESKVILLSATPYNMTYKDLSNQLKLFLPDDYDLGITPERYIDSLGGMVYFSMKHTDTNVRTINAFENSDYPDDWREVMKLFLVRRTRSFIKNNYAKTDTESGRKYLEFSDGSRSFFPDRIPKRATFALDNNDGADQYAKLYDETTATLIDELNLPRYGLQKYYNAKHGLRLESGEKEIIENLSRAGKRIIGFCRTNLFKRLESSGYSFLLSVSRHILRNCIFIYAINNGLKLPVSGQSIDVDMYSDNEEDSDNYSFGHTAADFEKQAELEYNLYATEHQRKFKWIRCELFQTKQLLEELQSDFDALLKVLNHVKEWRPADDRKLNALYNLLNTIHRKEKVIVFTQYSDTARYIYDELQKLAVGHIALTVGGDDGIVGTVNRFSPMSNDCAVLPDKEYRVLITTDVLSEGQNLQDAHIVVNFDLPWALVRLIQRAGRVDRIGQKSKEILCYSFLPEEGIDRIILLRSKLKTRISQNAEVVGSDEVFFDGDPINLSDLYNEKSGIFDETEDTEVDLASYAYQIWKNAIDEHRELKPIIEGMPNVVFSAKKNTASQKDDGVIVYCRTNTDNDALAWLDARGGIVTQSQYKILDAAKCDFEAPALPKLENHHELVKTALEKVRTETSNTSGTLGRKNSVKHRVYRQLERFYEANERTLFIPANLKIAMDCIFRYPLKETAVDKLSRQMKSGISDDGLCTLVMTLYENDELCKVSDGNDDSDFTQIICSMSLVGDAR
jgi:superfamily II DNA or RNA helicase